MRDGLPAANRRLETTKLSLSKTGSQSVMPEYSCSTMPEETTYLSSPDSPDTSVLYFELF
ncbi:MAG: hypothetical protein ACI4LO_03410 [Anaerovoracaceae bacterium]